MDEPESNTAPLPPRREVACSFCGETEPDVRIMAGARAFICDKCARLIAKFFDENPKGS